MRHATVLLCTLFLITTAAAQNAGDYRSHQTGPWSAAASWERFDGATWVTPAPGIPLAADGAITVRAAHTVTLDTSVAADQTVVAAGGTLLVAPGKSLTVSDGPDSIDLTVSGTLNNFGTLGTGGRIGFENGGLYIHSVPLGGVSVPVMTWRAGSTCRIDSSSGSAPTGLNAHSFHHFTWNAAAQSVNGGPNFNDGAVIGGDLTVTNSRGMQFRVANLSAGQTKTVTVRGNVLVNGPNGYLTSTGSGADTAARAIIVVQGNVTVSDGIWSLVNSSNAAAEWRVSGNVTISGGTLTSGASGTYLRRTLMFAGGGSRTFAVTAPGTIGTSPTTYKVANGTVVQVTFPLALSPGSALNLENGRFVTTAVNLITLPGNGTVIGGGPNAFVEGPLGVTVAAAGASSRDFPVGRGSAYRPVRLTVNHDSATATVYIAEMYNGAPPARTLPPTLRSVSAVRHYRISKGSGALLAPALGASVQLTYGPDDLVTQRTLLRAAKDDSAGTAWLNLGGSGTADTSGSITSNAFFSLTNNIFALAVADTGGTVVVPTLTTTAATYLSTTSVRSGGNVTNDGGGAVTARGVCWNTTGNPTVADARTSDGTGAGTFASRPSGLTPGGSYFLRAYATNSAGTGYGNQIAFTTLPALTVPSLTTAEVTAILTTTAQGGGVVTAWGGDSVTARGICWNLTGNPTVADSRTRNGSDIGAFTSVLAGLAPGTPYFVRAYATNGVGTGYGGQVTFTTATPAPAVRKVVARDGTGDYTTVQAAFAAVPDSYTGPWTIFVKRGVYYEKLLLAATKINVILVGEHRDSTILSFDDYTGRVRDSVVITTSTSYSVAIDAPDFVARNITFRNTSTAAQAVALRVNGDRQAYYDCNILGYQDTYYAWGGSATGRTYHKNCLVRGSVDFIFGRNIALFDSCTINVNRNTGTLTAASTELPARYGLVFRNSVITADSIGFDGVPITTFYLGRPWQASPRTVFLRCYEPSRLNAAGWQAWNVSPALYAEHRCTGPGAGTSGRVSWSSQLSDSAAALYTPQNIFAMNAYEPQFGFDWMPPPPPPISGVEEKGTAEAIPADFQLVQNFPNPFNPSTIIRYGLPRTSAVTVSIHNTLGQLVTTLVDGEREAGYHDVRFEAAGLASGVYFCRMKAGEVVRTRKLMLLR